MTKILTETWRLGNDMNSLKNQHFLHGNSRTAVSSSRPEKVRLLNFVCDFGSGGTEGQVFNLVRKLSSQHYELEFAALNKTGPYVGEYAKRGIAIRAFPIRSFYARSTFAQMFRFIKHLRKNRTEIMHAYNFYSLVFAIPAAKLAGVPVIIASIRDRGVYLTKTQQLLQKFVCRMADSILVNADSIRDWLLEQGYQQHKITVIKNGVDLAPYEEININRYNGSSIREDRGIAENASLVVMLARLNRHKGVADFMRAAALVRDEHPDARFLIVGKASLDSLKTDPHGSSDHQQWLDLRQELRLENTLFFCGHRSDVPRILSQAAVSVLPSHSEGLSNTLLESMAAGVPVVATRVGGTPELIDDGVNGILVPAHCPEQLAAGISSILCNETLAHQFSRAARHKVRQEFSLDVMVKRTQHVYESQLARREVLS